MREWLALYIPNTDISNYLYPMYNASLVYIYTPDYLNHCMNWDEYCKYPTIQFMHRTLPLKIRCLWYQGIFNFKMFAAKASIYLFNRRIKVKKYIFFQLQSQNMTVRPLSLIPLINAPCGKIQHVLYYRNYSADVFVVHNIFLECCKHALLLQYGLSWEARSSFNSYMYVPGKYYKISVARKDCDINAHLVVTSETILSTIERESLIHLFSLSLTIFISLSIPIVSNAHSRLDFAPF